MTARVRIHNYNSTSDVPRLASKPSHKSENNDTTIKQS